MSRAMIRPFAEFPIAAMMTAVTAYTAALLTRSTDGAGWTAGWDGNFARFEAAQDSGLAPAPIRGDA